MERDENGVTTATYTHRPEPNGKLISQHRNGATRFHHYDGQGNTRQLTDESGNVTDTATYTAFGETVQKTGSTVNPFGFKGALGYYANPETDDLYVRGRTYEPKIARWLSPNGRVFYNMFGNNPLNNAAGANGQGTGKWIRSNALLTQDMCDGNPGYRVFFNHEFKPAPPTGTEQVWQVCKCTKLTLDASCKKTGPTTKFVLDITGKLHENFKTKKRAWVRDLWEWKPVNTCYGEERCTCVIGFDDGTDVYAEQSSQEIPKAQADVILAAMTGPKDTYTSRFATRQCCACKCSLDRRSTMIEELRIDGVTRMRCTRDCNDPTIGIEFSNIGGTQDIIFQEMYYSEVFDSVLCGDGPCHPTYPGPGPKPSTSPKPSR